MLTQKNGTKKLKTLQDVSSKTLTSLQENEAGKALVKAGPKLPSCGCKCK
jgi:uncharacterized protein YbbK (DUF523 family)